MGDIAVRYKNSKMDDRIQQCISDSVYLRPPLEFCDGFGPEYHIIERINKNEEGYFDFSKNLVDIGAFIGEYTNLLHFKYNFCFEANKEPAALIYANAYIRNKVKETTVYNVCLSDSEYTTDYNGFCCKESDSPDYKNSWYGNPRQIQTTILDKFNIDNIGLIKIDVEGMEERVLRGGLGTIIRNNYPPILFECWDPGYYNMTQEKHDSLFNFIKSLGYEILEYWGDWETHLAIHK